MTFTSLHFTSPPINTLHSMPWFTPLHCTTLHFTSLHYTLWIVFNTHFLQFTTLITFLTLFLKAFVLQGRVLKISVGNWFQSQMVLFTKEYFVISILCLLFLIFCSWSTLLRQLIQKFSKASFLMNFSIIQHCIHTSESPTNVWWPIILPMMV